MPKFLSPHFTLEELVFSQEASRRQIDNKPSAQIVLNLVRLCGVLEQVRTLVGDLQIHVSSGYRSRALNTAVGGSPYSKHMEGLAADFIVAEYGTVLKLARNIATSGITYDQIIYEYGRWVHLGLTRDGETPRRQKLSIFSTQTGYIEGLINK